MSTPTEARRDLLTVIAYMHAKPGKEEELRAALEVLIQPTSEEDGYVNYDLHQGVEDPGAFFFYENWESAGHLGAHLATPHLQNFSSIADDLLDEGGLTITRLRQAGMISVFDLGGPLLAYALLRSGGLSRSPRSCSAVSCPRRESPSAPWPRAAWTSSGLWSWPASSSALSWE